MVQFNLTRLNLNEDSDKLFALEEIPAMQRRRLSNIAKIAINSAIQTLQGERVDYIVWSSQYGDEEKTLKILQDVLLDQTPSPTLFSTSVHNAISGLYSIFRQDDTVSTTLAASWSEALLEAFAYLKTHRDAKKALIVYFEQALPEIYQESHYFPSFALAGIMELGNENIRCDLDCMQTQRYQYVDAQNFNAFWQDKSMNRYSMWVKC